MKCTLRTVVLAGLVIFVSAMLLFGSQLQSRTNASAKGWHAPQLLADGGKPVPPFPPSSGLLLAGGGAPMPPWPGTPSVS
jgi:hypothetical protein